ncbi:aliphatic amidase regulator [Bradyrhizobium sp. NAS80.1]|uniref:ANTAR domain-containing response regulator n=1 Tax=Bradyrhizobium sp. NAS80.1 TaxID=1680159 RepID=UPI000962602B|nr:ANTAR domain-containing protein [Bradyrhizobium sp. NAS80.1]OKO76431.1 aliphatic amidase regulator [Bradyrhizobium sp. NAS80.1]
MSDQIPASNGSLLRQLRRRRVLVIHPEDHERDIFLAHLKRVGCQVDFVWPAPERLPPDIDVVFFLLGHLHNEKSLSWMAASESIVRMAIISFETPEILGELQRINVHGIITKPIRIFGILAALTTAVGIANHENRLKQRIRSLDETLKARRTIEKAVAILCQTRGIGEDEAYRRLRDKAMKSNATIASIADAIVASSDI